MYSQDNSYSSEEGVDFASVFMRASTSDRAMADQASAMQMLDDDIVEHLDHEAHQIHGRSGDISSAEIRTALYAIDGDLSDDLSDDLAESFGKVTEFPDITGIWFL